MNNLNFTTADLTRRNQAFDWMFEHSDEYPNAQELASAASTKYDIAVEHLMNGAQQFYWGFCRGAQ